MLAESHPNPTPPLRVVQQKPDPLAVDLKTAAAMVGCCTKFLKNEIESGALRGFRLNKRVWRVRVSELDAYMKRKEQRQQRISLPERGKQARFVKRDTPLLDEEK